MTSETDLAEATVTFASGTADASATYADWSTVAPITVADPSVQAGYQALLEVAYAAEMNTDFSDLRFTDEADAALPYHIISKTDSSSATARIALPANCAAYRLIYGNASATSESDPTIYAFHDDFAGASLDTAKWDAGGTPTVSGGTVTINAASEYIISKTAFGTNVVLEASGSISATNYHVLGFETAYDTAPHANLQYGYPTAANYNARTYISGAQDTDIGSGHTGTRTWAIVRNGSTNVIFRDGASTVATHATRVPTGNLKVVIAQAPGVAGGSSAIDWILVRMHEATEPACTVGTPTANVSDGTTGLAGYIDTAAASVTFAGVGTEIRNVPDTAAVVVTFAGTVLDATAAYSDLAEATVTLTGIAQALHFINFDALPTVSAPDPVTGQTYPTGTVGIPAATATVRRGVADGFWQLTETVDGLGTIPIDSLRAAKVVRQDHQGTNRCLFYGIVPALSYQLAWQADQTSVNGYDYGWYLSQQYVPSAQRIMPATTNPADFVETLLGENFGWESTTGVRPYRIANVDAWGTAALPAKEFVFEPRTTKWEAIQQLAEYCGFVFYTKWRPIGSVADVDNPDPSKRVIRIEAEDFDAGGEGVGYHDVDAANIGGAFRTAEGVDVEYFQTERGRSVGWIRDGEWLQFTRTFPWTGQYAVSARVAAEDEAASAYWTLYLDGAEQFTVYVGAQTLALGGYRTGSYQTFADTDPTATTAGGVTIATAAQNLAITAGEHVIKIVFGGNTENVVPSQKHQNLARLDCTPAGADGGDVLYQPVAYWVADADIDSATAGLDLPRPVVISDLGQYPEDGVEVMQNANERYNSVTVRGHSESGVYVEYTASFVSDDLPCEKFEESDKVVDAATAHAYADALLAYYRLDQWTYRMTLPQRFDLSLYQLITFVGHAKLPTDACRIVEVEHHTGFQDDWTTIEIVPNTTFLTGRKLRRMLFPAATAETQAIVDHALASQPVTHIGTAATLGTDTGTFALEEGGTMTSRIEGA